MIFDLLAPPQGPRGRGQKMCLCTPHSCEQLEHHLSVAGPTMAQLEAFLTLTICESLFHHMCVNLIRVFLHDDKFVTL